jgi:hypothetical protein
MQAQNVAVVDMMVLRHIERDIIERFYKEDRMPYDLVSLLSGLSQMWIYYLYEFFRTWRQRARALISASEQYEGLPTEAEKEQLIADLLAKHDARARLITRAPDFHRTQIEKISDGDFVKSVKAYYAETEGMFRNVEALRITLAKHEVPKTGKAQLLAEAPGYGRVDQLTGSMYWFFNLKDGTVDKVDRRLIANDFMHVADDARPIEENEPLEANAEGQPSVTNLRKRRSVKKRANKARLKRPIKTRKMVTKTKKVARVGRKTVKAWKKRTSAAKKRPSKVGKKAIRYRPKRPMTLA